MGVQDVAEQDELISKDELTIGDLKDMFGREVARRGLEYMASLSEADRNFRQASEGDMKEGYERAGVEGDVEPVASKWAEESRRKGLGIDGSEDE